MRIPWDAWGCWGCNNSYKINAFFRFKSTFSSQREVLLDLKYPQRIECIYWTASPTWWTWKSHWFYLIMHPQCFVGIKETLMSTWWTWFDPKPISFVRGPFRLRRRSFWTWKSHWFYSCCLFFTMHPQHLVGIKETLSWSRRQSLLSSVPYYRVYLISECTLLVSVPYYRV